MASKSEREIAADRPLPFKRKHKKNSGSVLTRRKHTKYVRPGDVSPDKSGRDCRYV